MKTGTIYSTGSDEVKPFFPQLVNTVDMDPIELSIVVPILNERAQLPELMANLARQQRVRFEVLFVDGGSTDGGPEWLQGHCPPESFFLSLLTTTAGRGRQLNHGGRKARGEWLLFLHVDSRFSDPLALRSGIDRLQDTGSEQVAGHFSLRFRRSVEEPSPGFYFYEWKARLGRPETIHGDQGFLLKRHLFLRLDGFREDMTVMEDTDFAERLRSLGQWLLLPAEISTSARRFESEGLWQRQLLGSLIMCFRDIGWQQFFEVAPGVYRQQRDTEKLQVRPFFQLLRRLFQEMDRKSRWTIWWQSGCYVRRHAWQLMFALDARRAFKREVTVGQGNMLLTRTFEPLYDLLTDNQLGRLAATLLLRLWFEVTEIWLRATEQGAGNKNTT